MFSADTLLVVISHQKECGLRMSVCLSVCLSKRISQERQMLSKVYTEFSVHVTCGRGSVLLWQRCDTLGLCTSAFVDDVT